MDIYNVREKYRHKPITDIPMRVTYYARVSTKKSEQALSLENQMEYYEKFIKDNPNWEFVEGYVDDGKSGLSTKKRLNFNRMINDGKAGLFDLIITKSISRLSRDTVDSISYAKELLNYGVAVFYETDNLNTIDEDNFLRLTIMSSIAEDESRKISSRVKFGHREAIAKGHVLGNGRIFGYTQTGAKLIIDENEAEMVREVFELYATGEYSFKQIEKILYDKGYRNTNNKKIAHSTLSNMIQNPKYKGYYVGNKVKIIDMKTKKQKFLPEEDWVMFKDTEGRVPAIVDEVLWNKANEIFRKRSQDVKGRQGICNHANLLTGKIICADCGKPYYRKDAKNRGGDSVSKWVCSHKIENGAASCNSFAIYESEIKPILHNAFTQKKIDVDAIIDEYLQLYYDNVIDKKRIRTEINELRKKIDNLEGQMEKLLTYNLEGKIDDSDFDKQSERIKNEREDKTEKLRELENTQAGEAEFKKTLAELKKTLMKAQKDAENGLITREFVDKYVEKIYAKPISETEMQLDIHIVGSRSEPYICTLGSRTGHTFKKMIQSYEQNMR